MNIAAPRDSEGYLVNPEDWNEDIAREIAREEDVELNETCWLALGFMREYLREHDIAPDVRHLISFLASEKGWSKKTAKQHVFELFPYGYVKQACKIAGMKKPRAWSTG
ncbi:MAG TPA: TusE/DsrC/DsvC family sulfur relay protein [Xanthomonadales bacterium]